MSPASARAVGAAHHPHCQPPPATIRLTRGNCDNAFAPSVLLSSSRGMLKAQLGLTRHSDSALRKKPLSDFGALKWRSSWIFFTQ
jgi:hypothetical protein